ncbi:unannotated protein [freshwater metagenome]|uniref:Unannotated protein n=1 Tax=freshwater metagenome TaxID=449393 RepID=A0A6J6M948_9ZZZZ
MGCSHCHCHLDGIVPCAKPRHRCSRKSVWTRHGGVVFHSCHHWYLTDCAESRNHPIGESLLRLSVLYPRNWKSISFLRLHFSRGYRWRGPLCRYGTLRTTSHHAGMVRNCSPRVSAELLGTKRLPVVTPRRRGEFVLPNGARSHSCSHRSPGNVRNCYCIASFNLRRLFPHCASSAT